MGDSRSGRNPTSPISQLLQTLGMTREDLTRHSQQMRQFLTAEHANSLRAFGQQSERPDSISSGTRSRGRSRTGSMSNASAVAQSPTPPITPVKAEPVDGIIPARQLDTMEMIMERKNRKEKRDRRNSNAQSRDGRRVHVPGSSASSRSATPQATPETPHHYRYYRDSVVGEASTSQQFSLESAFLPQTPRNGSQFKAPEPRRGPPETPSGRHIYSRQDFSPSRPLSPCSSPLRIVNIVSSPGPMRSIPLAEEEDEDELPYVLPPGPYPTTKPDHSYAALIGQAILSSPQHRLTLQDIYEWITTVYPFYKRDEQTWMNSIRHCLSTMAVFRKVPRGRNEGKSLWAIWDRDIECFANGGFRKALCSDMVKTEPAAKSGPKKRGTMEEALARKTKRRKKSTGRGEDDGTTAGPRPPMLSAPILPPFFPAFHPNPHHQPYYQAYVPQPLPVDVIFPPLPPSSNYHRVAALSASASHSAPSSSMEAQEPNFTAAHQTREGVTTSYRGRDPSPKLIVSSSSFIPDLTPNCSSSSSPPLSSQASLIGADARFSQSPVPSPKAVEVVDPDDEAGHEVDWLRTVAVDALDPSATLLSHVASKKVSKAKSNKYHGRMRHQNTPVLPITDSPTPERRTIAGKGKQRARRDLRTPSPGPKQLLVYPTTPPQRPSTPPRRKRVASNTGLQLSPHRTPISHAGLHMSPSASLAHYKSNLDPPPIAVYLPQAPLLSMPAEGGRFSPPPIALPDNVCTPSRKQTTQQSMSSGLLNVSPFAPITPKRLVFPGANNDSPFRTPSRAIFDPHDPGALLDEELLRQGLQESPSGLFGKSRGLLYESPSGPSPGSWERFW
ncbi:hypothetical protein AcV5_009232 [Taiwanofungus camphoratus]|nr:hypothetical protein AcV5_009232 [Antrodia cinnamomea]